MVRKVKKFASIVSITNAGNRWPGGRMAGWPWPDGRVAVAGWPWWPWPGGRGRGGRGGRGRVAVAVAGWPGGRGRGRAVAGMAGN